MKGEEGKLFCTRKARKMKRTNFRRAADKKRKNSERAPAPKRGHFEKQKKNERKRGITSGQTKRKVIEGSYRKRGKGVRGFKPGAVLGQSGRKRGDQISKRIGNRCHRLCPKF